MVINEQFASRMLIAGLFAAKYLWTRTLEMTGDEKTVGNVL
jgi:hypothetical protein